MPRRSILSLAALSLITLATACGRQAPERVDAAPPTAGASAVAPSLNERFTQPDLDVDTWVGRFERETREVYANREAIVAILGLAPGMAVADVGTGTGAFVPKLAAAVGTEGKVYALDISPKFIEHVRQRAAEESLVQVEARLSEQVSVGLPAASIDVALVCDTYHHFEHPAATLASVRAALKPGGRLVVVDFHRIEGKTKQWLLDHVRAGQDVFAAEIAAAGFTRLADPEQAFLAENYVMVFEAPR